ncbi:hypothetical protein BC834DRAFT_657507 [Gloeopeniophorella convolvens]|nr:hypothetical protein BC834DRAFT_657507 [Gloeopeniophorella convolvens]
MAGPFKFGACRAIPVTAWGEAVRPQTEDLKIVLHSQDREKIPCETFAETMAACDSLGLENVKTVFLAGEEKTVNEVMHYQYIGLLTLTSMEHLYVRFCLPEAFFWTGDEPGPESAAPSALFCPGLQQLWLSKVNMGSTQPAAQWEGRCYPLNGSEYGSPGGRGRG